MSVSALVWSFWVALAPGVTVVPVEADGLEPSKRMVATAGWLRQRLLEEGATIVPQRRMADIVLEIREQDGRFVLSSALGSRVVESDTRRDLMELELLHWARAMVGSAQARAGAVSSSVLYVVHQGPNDARTRERITARLVEAGFAVTHDERAADRKLCVNHTPGHVFFAPGPAGAGCSDVSVVLAVGDLERPDGFTPVEGALGGNVVGSVAPPPTVTNVAGTSSAEPPERFERRRARWVTQARGDFGIDAGVLARRVIDGTVRAATRIGMTSGLGGVLEVSVTPSRNRRVTAIDTILAAGPDLRFRPVSKIELGVAATVGTQIHSFSVDNHRGGYVDWYLGFPVTIAWNFRPGLGVYTVVQGALVSTEIRHDPQRDETAAPYRRSRWSVRAALGFRFGWRLL